MTNTEPIVSTEAVPLLASWGWDERIYAYSTHPEATNEGAEGLRALQARRAAMLRALDADFVKLLNYIAPAEENLQCYSPQIFKLLTLTCIEVEGCFKDILRANKVRARKNVKDYKVIEKSHSLSRFEAKLFNWHDNERVFKPFQKFDAQNKSVSCGKRSLPWYDTYNRVKHDNHALIKEANFEKLCEAMCGLHILLSSIFGYAGWEPHRGSHGFYSPKKFMPIIGNSVLVSFPEPKDCKVTYDLPRSWDFEFRTFDYTDSAE